MADSPYPAADSSDPPFQMDGEQVGHQARFQVAVYSTQIGKPRAGVFASDAQLADKKPPVRAEE